MVFLEQVNLVVVAFWGLAFMAFDYVVLYVAASRGEYPHKLSWEWFANAVLAIFLLTGIYLTWIGSIWLVERLWYDFSRLVKI